MIRTALCVALLATLATPAIASDWTDQLWTLVSVGNEPLDSAGSAPSLTFSADGTVSGFLGCNSLSGYYEIDHQGMRVQSMMNTQATCPQIDIETALSAILVNAAEIYIQDGLLFITGANGQSASFSQSDESN